MTDETLDGVFINPGFFGMCNKCFTAVMRVMRRDTEGLNSLIKVASIEFIAGVAIRTISAGKIEWIFIMVGFSIKVSFLHNAKRKNQNGEYPTVTVRQIMWALRMKPIKRERWETVFDRSLI